MYQHKKKILYPQISLAELYDMKKSKEKIKIDTFNEILAKCHKKIKTTASQGGMTMFFEIPFIILGYPLYDIYECVEYITDALRNNGLLVQILPHPNNNTIYISWKPTDVEVRKQLMTSKHSVYT
jgi:hypothetical protein